MSEINVLSRTQIIRVNPTSRAVSVTNAGPPGPPGSGGSLTTEQAVDAVAAALVAGDEIQITYDDPGGEITVARKREEVIHDWNVDGTGPFLPAQLMNDDVPTGNTHLQTLSVVNGRGRITNTGTQGSLRMVYPRDDTVWMDSEITTLCFGGDVFNNAGTNPALPQGGHFHRGYVDDDGVYRLIAINNNIFLSDVNVVNANVWNNDPSEALIDQLDLGSAGGSKAYADTHLLRQANIVGVRRLIFGISVNEYFITPPDGHGMEAGNMVTIDAVLDSTFDIATAQAISSVGNGVVQMQDMEGGGVVAHKYESGIITATSIGARRYWPYWIKSRLIGSKLWVKTWRQKASEPDWGDAAAVFTCDFAGANAPAPGALYPDEPGSCGLIGNHIRNARYFEYGYFHAKKL
jgi:hypothetical protein